MVDRAVSMWSAPLGRCQRSLHMASSLVTVDQFRAIPAAMGEPFRRDRSSARRRCAPYRRSSRRSTRSTSAMTLTSALPSRLVSRFALIVRICSHWT